MLYRYLGFAHALTVRDAGRVQKGETIRLEREQVEHLEARGHRFELVVEDELLETLLAEDDAPEAQEAPAEDDAAFWGTQTN